MTRRLSACLLLLVAWPASSGADGGPAWPQYGGPARDFILPEPAAGAEGPALLWRRPLGRGTSGIVSDGTRLFTMYSVPDPKEPKRGEEVVIALDARTGKTAWEHKYPVARLKGQESFSGDPVRPQATPAVFGDRVCTLGYAGLLKCFHAATGRVAWEADLVKDFGATPVQFGFASSPLVHEGGFVVHVGGKRAALVAFRAGDGKVKWSSAPGEPSYASPVLTRVGGEEQVVQVTRDAVLGVSAAGGETRWTYPLPKPGLTNVPTPISLPKGRLLVSGQGFLGTRLLEVGGEPGGLRVKELWANDKTPFFYCNWVSDADAVYGNVGPLLGGLGLADGKELWRERGQAEANQVRAGKNTLVLRGDGLLTRCRLTRAGAEPRGSYRLLKGRCWAAPTLLGGVVYARDEAEIAALNLRALAAE